MLMKRENPHGYRHTWSTFFFFRIFFTTDNTSRYLPPWCPPSREELRTASNLHRCSWSSPICSFSSRTQEGFHSGAATESGLGEQKGGNGVREVVGGRERRRSMIMYELSALLCGIRKECSGAFKKKIIMSGYRNTSVNTDFYWLTMLRLSEYEHLECEVAAKAFFNISRISRKTVSHFFSVSFLQVLQTALKKPSTGVMLPPLSTLSWK